MKTLALLFALSILSFSTAQADTALQLLPPGTTITFNQKITFGIGQTRNRFFDKAPTYAGESPQYCDLIAKSEAVVPGLILNSPTEIKVTSAEISNTVQDYMIFGKSNKKSFHYMRCSRSVSIENFILAIQSIGGTIMFPPANEE
jgi:hypothetical protein